MFGYLSADIICSEKRTVFRDWSSRKNVNYEEQIMSKDKYSSIFLPQMEAIVFIILQIFFATCASFKIGEYSRIFPSFSWGIFGHMMHLDQSHASRKIWWIINNYNTSSDCWITISFRKGDFTGAALLINLHGVYNNNSCLKSYKDTKYWQKEKTIHCVFTTEQITLWCRDKECQLRGWVSSLDNNRSHIIACFLVVLIVAAITVGELKIKHRIEANWIFNAFMILFNVNFTLCNTLQPLLYHIQWHNGWLHLYF